MIASSAKSYSTKVASLSGEPRKWVFFQLKYGENEIQLRGVLRRKKRNTSLYMYVPNNEKRMVKAVQEQCHSVILSVPPEVKRLVYFSMNCMRT